MKYLLESVYNSSSRQIGQTNEGMKPAKLLLKWTFGDKMLHSVWIVSIPSVSTLSCLWWFGHICRWSKDISMSLLQCLFLAHCYILIITRFEADFKIRSSIRMIFPKLKLKVDAVCTFGPDHSQNSSTLRPPQLSEENAHSLKLSQNSCCRQTRYPRMASSSGYENNSDSLGGCIYLLTFVNFRVWFVNALQKAKKQGFPKPGDEAMQIHILMI